MSHIKGLSYLTAVLIGFLSVTDILGSPTAKTLGNLNPLPYEQKSRRHTSRNPLEGITAGTLSINPRADPFHVLPIGSLQPGWQVDFYDYDWGYLPVASASAILQRFYMKIFQLAATASGSIPERAVLSFGQLDLEVASNSGAVAWESVAAFAAHMLRTAQRGYTNSYHCHMTNMATGVFISFNLYVRATRQPAPKFND